MTQTASETKASVAARRRIDELENAVAELGGALNETLAVIGTLAKTLPRSSTVLERLERQRQRYRHILDKTNTRRRVASVAAKKAMLLDKKTAADAAGSSAAVPESPARATGGLAGAAVRGEAAKVEWVRTGELVPAKQLSGAWGLTPQALGPAERRGEVFALTVKRQRFYPREFLQLNRGEVAAVCQALEGLSPVEQLFFWKKRHGALKGKTVPEALAELDVARVVSYARSQTSQLRADAVTSA